LLVVFFHKLTAVFQKPFLNCASKVAVVVTSEIGVYRDQALYEYYGTLKWRHTNSLPFLSFTYRMVAERSLVVSVASSSTHARFSVDEVVAELMHACRLARRY